MKRSGSLLPWRDSKICILAAHLKLETADENGCQSIAFCCISTGVFMFPNQRAAEIAVETVENYLQESRSPIMVVFNVFKDSDRAIYEALLQ